MQHIYFYSAKLKNVKYLIYHGIIYNRYIILTNYSSCPIFNSNFRGSRFIANFPFTIMQDFAGNCTTRLVPCLLTRKGETCCEHGHEINKTVEDLMPLFKGSCRRERSHETQTQACTGGDHIGRDDYTPWKPLLSSYGN